MCTALGELGERHRLLVVPGGAGFADAVRDADRRFGLSAEAAHRMAILGMEQFGWLLSELIPGAERCADLARVGAGRTTVLLPAALPLDALPASWQVTSDSIAAWVAGQVGAGRLVLVKEVDGLFAEWPPRGEPLARLTVAELAALRPGGVDEYLPDRARARTLRDVGDRRPSPAWSELLERGTTVGTRIARACYRDFMGERQLWERVVGGHFVLAKRSFWPDFFSRLVARLQWNPMAIDLAPDARAWPELPAERRDRLMTLLAGFCVAEDAVAEHADAVRRRGPGGDAGLPGEPDGLGLLPPAPRRAAPREALRPHRRRGARAARRHAGRAARRGPRPRPAGAARALRGAAARDGRRARRGATPG